MKPKILIIRFSALGDILMCTPLIRCLHLQMKAEIYFLTKKSNAVILKENPHIHQIIVLTDLWQTLHLLRNEHFDLIVDLHKNLRSFFFRFFLGCHAPVVSYPKYTFRRYLSIHLHQKQWLPKSHVCDRYFKAVKKYKVHNDGLGMEYYNFAPEKSLPLSMQQICQSSSNPYLIIAIGSRHATKQMPIKKIVFLCQNIPFPILLVGDKNDQAKALSIQKQISKEDSSTPVWNMCGLLSFDQTATLVLHANLIISGDSALMHLSAALQKDLISVWGSTVPELGMYPYYPMGSEAVHTLFENKNLRCRPCHKHGYDRCPKKHFCCMNDLDFSSIALAVERIWKHTTPKISSPKIYNMNENNLLPNQDPASTPGQAIERLIRILTLLRKDCPWDKKQTFETLRCLTIEETYELSESLLENEPEEIKKELGDLLLHIAFYSQIGAEKNLFDFTMVTNGICEKLIRRHPHIFSDVQANTAEQVKQNWEEIKLKEGSKHSVLAGVPSSLPATVKAFRIQEKARGVGFDWDNSDQVWDKVLEELDELKVEVSKWKTQKTEEQHSRMNSELGDLLFAIINYARFIDVNPDDALEHTNKKFIRRFKYLEEKTIMQGQSLHELTLDQMNVYWNEAKTLESDNL